MITRNLQRMTSTFPEILYEAFADNFQQLTNIMQNVLWLSTFFVCIFCFLYFMRPFIKIFRRTLYKKQQRKKYSTFYDNL